MAPKRSRKDGGEKGKEKRMASENTEHGEQGERINGSLNLLQPRRINSFHVKEATTLFRLAANWYKWFGNHIQLPAFDERKPADGSAAVELCLTVRTGSVPEHVDRALFNLVTGSPSTMAKLQVEDWQPPAWDTAGGVVEVPPEIPGHKGSTILIPGMTMALLLPPNTGAPHKHWVHLDDGESLTVLAVKVSADIPAPGLQGIPLQTALMGCFFQLLPPIKKHNQRTVNISAPEEGEGAIEGSKKYRHIRIRGQDGNTVYFRFSSTAKASKVMEAYCERSSLDPSQTAFLLQAGAYEGRRLKPHQVLFDVVEDGDEIAAMLHQQGD